MDSIEDRVAATPCPACGQSRLRFTTKLESRPIGTFSLAGAQLKTSAIEWPYVVCDNETCDFEQRAKQVTREESNVNHSRGP